MLSGARPFHGATNADIMKALLSTDPPPLSAIVDGVPESLSFIVSRCLQKSVNLRYRDADALGVELRKIDPGSLSNGPADAKTIEATVSTLPRSIRKPRSWRVIVAAVVVGASTTGGYVAYRGIENRNPPGIIANSSDSAEAFRQARQYLQRYDRKGNVDRAIAELEPAAMKDPANAALQSLLAESYWRKSVETGDTAWLQKAAAAGKTAIAANDSLAIAHAAFGIVLAASGQNEQASAELVRAVELDPLSSQARTALAKVRFAEGKRDEAEQLHLGSVESSPDEWLPLTELGVFYYRTARYDDAVSAWRKALLLSPDNVIVMRNLGPGFFQTGGYAEASAVFQRALEQDSTAVSTWANLGTALYFQGRFAEGAHAMEKAVELAPNNYLYWGNLGDGYRWAPGLRSKAFTAYSNAIRLAREKLALALNDTAIRSSLAAYLAKTGDTAAALSEAAQVERSSSNSASTFFKIALVHELAQDREKALLYLQRAIESRHPIAEVMNEPEFAALRGDARFEPIIKTSARTK
jgi:serine/threonine-protein kinase